MQPLSAFRQYLMTYGLLDKGDKHTHQEQDHVLDKAGYYLFHADVHQTVVTDVHPKHLQNAPSQQSMQSAQSSDPTWTERMGIRHLNDEEWAQHEQEKREQMRKR